MPMYGSEIIEMMHFPGRLNVGISAVTFDNEEKDDRIYGFSILQHYLNECISMTGKYSNDYALKVNSDEKVLRLINDTWGHYNDERKIVLKPNYSLTYSMLNEFTSIKDCITITFPNTNLNVERRNATHISIELLADLFLKASIKSLAQKDKENFEIHIFRINTFYNSFHRFSDNKIRIEASDFKNLISEISKTELNGHKFLYFYNDDWNSHYCNFKNLE